MRQSSTRSLHASVPSDHKLKRQSSKTVGGSGDVAPAEDARHVSKLESEVLRLEARGTALVQTEGHEIEGVDLLEKALKTRARFNALNADAWQRAEQFVMVCNQLAVRTMQRLDDSYVHVANHLMAAAERALCNASTDPFGGFHPLRQSLLGSTLSNMAALTVLNSQPIEAAVAAVEKALAVEAPRPSTLSLFNLAALYVRQGRFDGAMEMATKVIALADHYLRLHVNLNPETEGPFGAFSMEAASHAVLSHHLISAVASWSGQWNVAQHHAKLALRCSERYLGEHHALTTRAIHRVQAVAVAIGQGKRAVGDPNTPPHVPLQMATFSSPFTVSRLLPFTLVAPFPSSLVDVRTDASNLPAIFNSGAGGSTLKRSGEKQQQPQQQQSAALPAITRGAKPSTLSGSSRGLLGASASGAPHAGTLSSSKGGAAPSVPSSPAGPALQRPPATSRPPPATASGARPVPRPPAGDPPSKIGTKTVQTARPAPPSKPRGAQASGRSSQTSMYDGASVASTQGTATTISELPPQRTPTQSELAAHDPVIEAWATPKQVSTVAKLDYEMYRQLQEEVAGFVHTQAQPSPIGTASSTRSHKRRYAAGALGFSDADVAHAIAVSDGALTQLSEVRPDHTEDDERRWDAAARHMQRWARLILARLAVAKRSAARDAYLRRVDAVERIGCFYLAYRLRRMARNVLEAKRRAKRLSDFFGQTVQASARAYLSYVEYCTRVQRHLQQKLDELNLATRRTIAATGVQAVWRSYAVRKDVSRRIAMARRIQRFYRTYCAFLVVRTLVFQRRTGARASWKKQDMAALRIQVWYKHYIKQVKAIADRKGRLARAEAFSEERVEREAAAWRRVAGVDEDLMAVRLQRFFSGIVWRKREHMRQTTMRSRRSAASKIQRCWRWSKASTIQDRKREQRASQRATRKRIEEVTEATLDMQRIARRFLARLEFHRRVERGVQRNDAACVLQRVLYIIRARRLRRERSDEVRWAAQRYLLATERSHAATKIQSVFRMQRDRAFAKEYHGFMSRDRHVYAARLQRAFRYFAARKVRQGMLAARSEARNAQIAKELELQSILRIQHAIRSFMVRRLTRRRAAVPVSKQAVAANRIQRIVRYMIARAHVSRLQAAREHVRASQRGDEHLAAYAMVLQGAIRRRILAPKRIAVAAEARRISAAVRIQAFVRRCLSRRETASLMATHEAEAELKYEEEERIFAAIRIQKTARAMLVRRLVTATDAPREAEQREPSADEEGVVAPDEESAGHRAAAAAASDDEEEPVTKTDAAQEAADTAEDVQGASAAHAAGDEPPSAAAVSVGDERCETAAASTSSVAHADDVEKPQDVVSKESEAEEDVDAATLAARVAAVNTIARAFRVSRSNRTVQQRRQARSDAIAAQLQDEQHDAATRIQRSWRKRAAAKNPQQ